MAVEAIFQMLNIDDVVYFKIISESTWINRTGQVEVTFLFKNCS